MTKHFFKISFYSLVTFCTVNFCILIYSIIYNKLQKTFPELSFGFPFEIYHQFEVKSFKNCYELQHGSFPKNLVYNYLIFWIIVFLFYSLKTKNFNLTTNHKKQK